MKVPAADLKAGDMVRFAASETGSARVTGTNHDGDHVFVHFGGKSMRCPAARVFTVVQRDGVDVD